MEEYNFISASAQFGLAYITVIDLSGHYMTENLFSYSLN